MNKHAVPWLCMQQAQTQILMLSGGLARTWQIQELASLHSHVMALGHKHVNKYVHSTTG